MVTTEQSPEQGAGRTRSCCEQHREAQPGWPGQRCRAGPPGCRTNPLPISQLHLADFTSQFLSDHQPEDTVRATNSCLKNSVCFWFQTQTSLTSWSPVSGYTLPSSLGDLVGNNLSPRTLHAVVSFSAIHICCIPCFQPSPRHGIAAEAALPRYHSRDTTVGADERV